MKKILIALILTINLFASIENEVDKSRFLHKNGVLIDTFSELAYQDEKYTKDEGYAWVNGNNHGKVGNWKYANQYCKKLNLNGVNNWRLPTQSELRYISTFKNNFNNLKERNYWSSTTYSSDNKKAWYVWYTGSSNKYSGKRQKFYFRCIQSKNNIKYDNLNTLKEKVNNTKKIKINKKYNVIYEKIDKINTIEAYDSFIKNYPNATITNNAKIKLNYLYKQAYLLKSKDNTLQSYKNFIKQYPKAPQIKNAIENLYTLVNQQNNISGYEWFIKKYPKAPQVKEAIKNIHKLAYNKAKDINTVSAYNTFVYAYPTASQVREANDKAYEIESKKYTDIGMIGGFFQKEAKMEKKARKLLIKAKQIERTAQDYNGNAKAGYIIVANRMYQLLQDKFDDSEATLNYMDSLDFKDFSNSFKQAMKDIKYILNKINNNTSDISRYAQESLTISKQGFEDAKADRKMTKYKNEQHHKWEKKMHLMEKGYN